MTIAVLAVAGLFTGWTVVVFGFITFGLIYFGMMFVLPYNAGHPQPVKAELAEPAKVKEVIGKDWKPVGAHVGQLHYR